jgi:DNA-binding XRE family transcriptional regulator
MNTPTESNLRDHRESVGLSQTQLGQAAGTSRNTIARIENGQVPGCELALQIGAALDRCDD